MSFPNGSIYSNLVYIEIEYFEGETLLNYIQKCRLDEMEAKLIFIQLLSALKYMGCIGVCHRDIKLENILINKKLEIKLIDFGQAVVQSQGKLDKFCGSKIYRSPEIQNKKPYHGKQSDVFACGVVLFTLIYGQFPFEEASFNCPHYKLLNENPSRYWE